MITDGPQDEQENRESGDSLAPPPGKLNGSRKKVAFAGLFVLAVIAGLVRANKKGGIDLPVYTEAASRMLAGEEIYRPRFGRPFTYPPFFAVPVLPLALLPESLHRSVWFLVNVGVLVWIFILLARRLEPGIKLGSGSRAAPQWLFWLAVLLLSGRHLSAVFENQSHDLLVFLCVMLAVDAFCAGAEKRAGLMAGLGAACKATPLLFVLPFAVQKRYRALLCLPLAAVLATLAPDVLFPRNDGGCWVLSWHANFLRNIRPGEAAEAEGAWAAWNFLNQNLASTFYRLSTPVEVETNHVFDVSLWHPSRAVLKYLTMMAQVGIIALIAFVVRPGLTRNLPEKEEAFRRLGEGGAVACGMVLLSPMSSKAHFCVLLVPIAFCVADYLYRKRDRAVGLLLLVSFVFGTLTVKGILGKKFGNILLAHGTVTLCALACLGATAHILWHRATAWHVDTPPRDPTIHAFSPEA